MDKYWLNPKSAAYLSTPGFLHKFLQSKGIKKKFKDVKKYVQSKTTYQKTKEKKRPRNDSIPMLVSGPNLSQQCDLAFFATKNSRNKNVALVCVDVFSSRIYARLMKQKKSAAATWSAYSKLLSQMPRKPASLSTDGGSEFKGVFAKNIANLGIRQRTLQSYQKAATSENAIHRIKQAYRRAVVHTGSRNINKMFPEVVARLNRKVNRLTGFRPIDVTYKNAGTIFYRRYGDYFDKLYNNKKPPEFKFGDKVRISKNITAGDQKLGALPFQKFSDKIFTIRNVRKTFPPTYEIVDKYLNRPARFFYAHQLVLAE